MGSTLSCKTAGLPEFYISTSSEYRKILNTTLLKNMVKNGVLRNTKKTFTGINNN